MKCIYCDKKMEEGKFAIVFRYARIMHDSAIEEKDVHDEVTDAVSCVACVRNFVLGRLR